MLIRLNEVGFKENIFFFIKIVYMYNDRSINLKLHGSRGSAVFIDAD